MNTNHPNTITVAPDADFHLFISAGASIYFWIAGALLVGLLVAIFMENLRIKQAAKSADADKKRPEVKP